MGPKVAKNRTSPKTVMLADGISKHFRQIPALSEVDLEILEGELVGLVGPDGAGKTTLMRILAGLMKPDQGEARVMGQDPMGKKSSVRTAMGYMPQAYSLYGDLSVDENLSFFSRMFGIPKEEYSKRRKRLLEITRLAEFTGRRASELSGGMYKKLALACSLLHRPRVLLLDEPTNGVDPVSRKELWELLREFVSDGMAVLISTAYMDEAARCSKVNLMHHGKIISRGRPAELLKKFSHKAFVVLGATRRRLEAILESTQGIVTLSPAGNRIRVVVHGDQVTEVKKVLSNIGATLVETRPDFEDLFLSELSETQDAGEP